MIYQIKTPLVVDVSAHEANVTWANVQPKPLVAICRATYGRLYVDPWLKEYFAQWAKLGGILRGSYMFQLHDQDTGDQCDVYIRTVEQAGGHGELPPILDVEDEGLTRKQVRQALDHLERELEIRPMIYTRKSIWDPIFGSDTAWCKEYKLWAAWYPWELFVDLNNNLPAKYTPAGWEPGQWALWQYAEAGRLEGIPYDGVDLNKISEWYLEELLRLQPPEPEPEPEPTPKPVYVGSVIAPDGVNVRSAPVVIISTKVGSKPKEADVEGVAIYDSPDNRYRWLELTDGNYVALGTQDGTEKYVVLAGDVPELPQLPQSQNLWRVRHEKPPRERGFPNPPEVYPGYVSPNTKHGTARTRLSRNGWEPYFRWLLGNDEHLFQYAIGPALVMFNKQARDDWENGGDAMESLWFGGAALTGDDQGAWLKIKTLDYLAGPLMPWLSYWDDPLAVQKAVTVNSKNGRIDAFPLKGDPPKPTYYPVVCGQDVYMPMSWLEPFPPLPMQVQVKAPLGVVERAEHYQQSERIGSYAYNRTVTISEYRLHGSEVWGRTERGWIALYWPYSLLWKYLTTWRMETEPAPV